MEIVMSVTSNMNNAEEICWQIMGQKEPQEVANGKYLLYLIIQIYHAQHT